MGNRYKFYNISVKITCYCCYHQRNYHDICSGSAAEDNDTYIQLIYFFTRKEVESMSFFNITRWINLSIILWILHLFISLCEIGTNI